MWVVLKKVDSDRVATAALHGNLWENMTFRAGDGIGRRPGCISGFASDTNCDITRTVAQAAFRRDS